MKSSKLIRLLSLLLIIALAFCSCNQQSPSDTDTADQGDKQSCPGCNTEGADHGTCGVCGEYLCIGAHIGCDTETITCSGCNTAGADHGICDICGEYLCVGDHSECAIGTESTGFDYSSVPAYTNQNYTAVNGNIPYFTDEEITSSAFESYGELDELGRCTTAFACLGQELMPTGSKPSLSYNPTGWVQATYPASVVPQQNIYNRSHLIAWSLSGEGNNMNNLMTGTPYFNQIGMQEFENLVLDYIKETNNHVMYRVTPIFVGDNLLANGALIEALSVEDDGEGICFNVFVYNVQPGIIINYATGETELENAIEYDELEPIYENVFNVSLFDSSNSTQYKDRTSSDGWSGSYLAILTGSTYPFMGEDTKSVVINGGSDKKGNLTSCTLDGGISALAFNYGFCFKDTQFSLTISIKQNGETVAVTTLDESSLESNVAYTFNWVLDVPISGEFIIEIQNNAKSNVSGNKDRLSLFNISWAN